MQKIIHHLMQLQIGFLMTKATARVSGSQSLLSRQLSADLPPTVDFLQLPTACIAGPSTSPSSCVGLLNARSALHTAALIHDVIADNKLDILLLTETWIPSDASDAAKFDIAPSGYTVVHCYRAASTEHRGGGLAVIHCDSFRATLVDVGDYSEFESLALRLSLIHI